MNQETHVFINTRRLQHPVSGVERYTEEIIRNLPGGYRQLQPARKAGGIRGHLWEQLVLPLSVGNGLLWSPANTGPLRVPRQVLTIHDLAPLDHPEWYEPAFARWYGWLWAGLVPRVRQVVTVSDYFRERLIERFRIDERRVVSIPVGVDGRRFSPFARQTLPGLPEPYILFVGTLQPRKNAGGLLAAWEMVRDRYPDWTLVIAGAQTGPFARSELLPGECVRLLGRVAEADLPALYAAAEIFIQPSFYEGAGLTLLEAMSSGCACAVSGRTALPEYAGDAALLFDPEKPQDIAAALEQLLGDRGLREQLRAKGLLRARAFTWTQTAERLWEVLESLQL